MPHIAIHHVRDHHDGVDVRVRELERLLDALDVVGQHPRLTKRLAARARSQRRLPSLLAHS
eukprot:scaffold33622_cov73-Isochrysis_galbana.AAC.1